MTETTIVHIASTTPRKAMCGEVLPSGGVPPGPVDRCPNCGPLFQSYRRGEWTGDHYLSPRDEDFLRRWLEARNPLHGRPLPPPTMTLAEMRAEGERRAAQGLPDELDRLV